MENENERQTDRVRENRPIILWWTRAVIVGRVAVRAVHIYTHALFHGTSLVRGELLPLTIGASASLPQALCPHPTSLFQGIERSEQPGVPL